MRNLMGCLSDPYVHVILIAVVLASLATGSGTASSKVPALIHCQTCHDYHDADEARCLILGMLGRVTGERN